MATRTMGFQDLMTMKKKDGDDDEGQGDDDAYGEDETDANSFFLRSNLPHRIISLLISIHIN